MDRVMANCDYCHQPIPPKTHPYTLKLELYPAIEPSVEITYIDLAVDFKAEMERLIKIMEEMNDSEVASQEKLLFIGHRFTLCPACRNRLAKQLESFCPPTS
jgi:hypothetical protein